ncbi:MAG: DUF4198 domain-containing protein [Azonexus sp.]|jgi:hypothetical protein|uniref:hypothetical protein n=1 Tax=Azonexus sp. TaxID=1872668 RepID=UPI00281D889F|nr:hypothetical protein [Azonexus sp.]MDR0776583.1 DUF4198 domain-containing protein [Azonexus sp.]
MRSILVFALLFGMTGLLWAQHDEHRQPTGERGSGRGSGGRGGWTAQPLLLLERGDERASTTLRVRGPKVPSVTVFGPAGGEQEFQLVDGRAKIQVANTGIGNYHWLQVRDEKEQHVGVATTVWYSSLAGPSPRRLLETRHSELEIVPTPLPREHANYRESEKWRFMVRYEGQPLAEQRLLLETENGSRSAFVTDAQGVATVLFPRDFAGKPGRSGHGPRPRAGFVLSTEHVVGERHFVTTFNTVYGEDIDRGRSLGWGAAFGVFGMLSALPLLRRRKRSENKEQSC